MKKHLLLLIVPFFFVSCATTSTTTSATPPTIPLPENNSAFVEIVADAQFVLEQGGMYALQYAVNDTDRLQIAQLLSGFGHWFESLQNGKIPSDDVIKNSLTQYIGSNTKYLPYANTGSGLVIMLKNKIKSYVPSNNATVVVAYFNYVCTKLAKTAYTVADPILQK